MLGDSSILTINGDAGLYQWSHNLVWNSVTVTLNVLLTVTGTNSYGCTVVQTLQ